MSTKIETPEQMAVRLYRDSPCEDDLAQIAARDAIRADREQIRAALLEEAALAEGSVGATADWLRAFAERLGGGT